MQKVVLAISYVRQMKENRVKNENTLKRLSLYSTVKQKK